MRTETTKRTNIKWTILTDNRTYDARLQTEHGLSVYVETKRHRLLLDTGASDLFLRNAQLLGIDLGAVDYVFISHGHSDHAGGLRHFLRVNSKAKVIVSPHAIKGEFLSERLGLHSITARWPEDMSDRLLLADKTQEMAEGLHVMAHIAQRGPVPRGNSKLFVRDEEGSLHADDFRHELTLYTEGLLFTGCAHSGLENILAACPHRVDTVLGGFHLLDGQESDAELSDLAQRLCMNYPQVQFYTSHCTGDGAFRKLQIVMGQQLHPFSCGVGHVSPQQA